MLDYDLVKERLLESLQDGPIELNENLPIDKYFLNNELDLDGDEYEWTSVLGHLQRERFISVEVDGATGKMTRISSFVPEPMVLGEDGVLHKIVINRPTHLEEDSIDALLRLPGRERLKLANRLLTSIITDIEKIF